MSLKELHAVSLLLGTADPWPLTAKDRQIAISLMHGEDRTRPMDLQQLEVLIQLAVATEPTVLDSEIWATLYNFLNRQAKELGFDDWADVYQLSTAARPLIVSSEEEIRAEIQEAAHVDY